MEKDVTSLDDLQCMRSRIRTIVLANEHMQ